MPDLVPCLAAAASSGGRAAARAPVLASGAAALGGACGAGRRSLEGSCAAADGKLLGFSILAARGCAGAGLAAHHPKRVRLLHPMHAKYNLTILPPTEQV